jgi:hypothetical protein
MSSRVPLHVIKAALQERLHRLVVELVPGVSERDLRGRVCQPKNPMRPDRRAGSFTIWMQGQARGCFKDFATGEKGDVLDLVAYCKGGGRSEGVRWAMDWLGLTVMTEANVARMRESATRRRAAAEAEQARADARIIARAQRLWNACGGDVTETPVSRYYAARGVPLHEIPGLEWGDLRWHPNLEWWRGRTHDADGVVTEGPRFPAAVWAIRDRAGALCAVHCTFIRADGLKKANVGNPKLMLGLVLGGVIRLTRGVSNRTPEQAGAAEAGVLALSEGPENGLTLARAAPEARVWAATSLGNLGNVPVDHPCASALVVVRDNDWGKPQAIDAFEAAIDRLREAGKPLEVLRSHWGKDVNDAVREEYQDG